MKKRPVEQELDEITGKAINGKVNRRLFGYLGPFRWTMIVAMGFMFTNVGINLYAPRLLGRIVDGALIPRDHQLLLLLVGLFVGLELLGLSAKFISSYMLQKVGQEVLHALRQDLFGRLTRMPVPFYDRNPTGRLVTRITNDTANLMEIFGPGFVTLAAELLLVLGTFVGMLLLDWRLGLVAISLFPIMTWAMIYFAGRLRVAYREARYSLSALNAFFAERMSGMGTVQLMGMQAHERKRFDALSHDYYERQMASVYVFAFFHPTITILSSSSIALVLYFGGRLNQGEQLPIGVFVSFLAYVQLMFQPVRSLTEKYNIYQNAMSSAERIFSLLDLDEEKELRADSLAMKTRLRGEIEFQNVFFAYGDNAKSENWALRSANFHLNAGSRIAVVGHTGAGKSTLISLLFRFYDPQRGTVLIDGAPISAFPKAYLRRRIGYVQQDVFIFAGTIRENLALLGEGVSDDKMRQAAQLTGLDRVVAKLPNGYETRLDERGSNLSLGERQVLAFTRVLLQGPDILVLDEATSHIDTESEHLIQKAMAEATRNRSSIIIAHRLSTIESADKILVFEKGQIIEAGTHPELVQKKGAYYRFSQSQFNGSEAHPSVPTEHHQ